MIADHFSSSSYDIVFFFKSDSACYVKSIEAKRAVKRAVQVQSGALALCDITIKPILVHSKRRHQILDRKTLRGADCDCWLPAPTN